MNNWVNWCFWGNSLFSSMILFNNNLNGYIFGNTVATTIGIIDFIDKYGNCSNTLFTPANNDFTAPAVK